MTDDYCFSLMFRRGAPILYIYIYIIVAIVGFEYLYDLSRLLFKVITLWKLDIAIEHGQFLGNLRIIYPLVI